MAGSFTLPTVLANLTAGNQALSLVDGDLTTLRDPLLALSTFANYYTDTGAANAYAITVSAPQTVALAAGLPIQFKATNANTGASTLQINALASKNILTAKGTALSSGQIPAGAVISVMYDGTQFMLLGGLPGNFLSTEVASTSGTTIDFTGLPSTAYRITMSLDAVSTNGTSALRVQLGDSGGIETNAYVGANVALQNAAAVSVNVSSTAAFEVVVAMAAADNWSGVIVMNLIDAPNNTWALTSQLVRAGVTAQFHNASGIKSTSATLDRVRLTTATPDTFDAGAVNVSVDF